MGSPLPTATLIEVTAWWTKATHPTGLGPFVKASGFTTLLFTMAVIASLTLLAVSFLPNHDPEPAAAA